MALSPTSSRNHARAEYLRPFFFAVEDMQLKPFTIGIAIIMAVIIMIAIIL